MSRDRIRIAFCIDSFGIGGTELNAVRTAEALDPERYELCLIHLQSDGPLRARYEKLGLHLEYVPISNLYSARSAIQGLRLSGFLRRWGADVVHAHDIYSNIFVSPYARILTRCAVIASRRWMYVAPRASLFKLNRLSNLFAHRVLANSSGVASLLNTDEKVPLRKIIEIPNFLEEHTFELVSESDRIEQRRAWGVPDGAFVIGTVARLAPVKNHAQILKAAARLATMFHVVFIGDGPSRKELEGLAKELAIESRVHFIGEVLSPVNLHQFFDVSTLCSLSEGFPNSVIEAMAAARPVVATPVGGVIDVVENEKTGITIPCNDVGELVNALLKISAEPHFANHLAGAGCSMVRKRFHEQVVIGKLSELYENLTCHHGLRSGRTVPEGC